MSWQVSNPHPFRRVAFVEDAGFELRVILECGHITYISGSNMDRVPKRRRCLQCPAPVRPPETRGAA